METHAFASKNSIIVENFFEIIHDFFDYRKFGAHLHFLDYWAGKISGRRSHNKHLQPSELLFYIEKITGLLNAVDSLIKENAGIEIQKRVEMPKNLLRLEQQTLLAWPGSLKTKELCNPLRVIHSLFKADTVDFYKDQLQRWLEAGLKSTIFPEPIQLYPVYRNIRRLIEACWLIHERSVSKNSRQLFQCSLPNIHFSLSCPLLLKDEFLYNPYQNLETFFSFSTLDSYKNDLKQWFKVALDENSVYENPSDLYFLYGQFTQLLQACYLIGTSRLIYRPQIPYSEKNMTFGHWVLSMTFPHEQAPYPFDYLIQNLPEVYHDNPVRFFSEKLTDLNVINIRKRLEGWFEAGISHRNNLITLDYDSIYEQYEIFLQLFEAAFLLIVAPALRCQTEHPLLPEN